MPESTEYTTARLLIEALCTAFIYIEISSRADRSFLAVRLPSFSFIVSLEIMTYGPQFDSLWASLQPQAEGHDFRAAVRHECRPRRHVRRCSMTACRTVQNRPRRLALALTAGFPKVAWKRTVKEIRDCWCEVFTDRIPFLSCNQQCQSSEEMNYVLKIYCCFALSWISVVSFLLLYVSGRSVMCIYAVLIETTCGYG